MVLPDHVQAVLGINFDVTEADLAANEIANQFAQTTFGLSGAEFASAATYASSGHLAYLLIAAKRAPNSWKYLEILHEGSLECAGVCTPETGAGLPPTAAAQVLVGAWFFDHTLLNENNIVPQKVVYGVKASAAVSTFPLRLLKEWTSVCPLLDGCVVPPIWVSKNQIQLTPSSRIHLGHLPGFRFQDLFIETVSEVKAKWRYLSVYRIFEHGYLSEIFETLKSTFFSSPKESLLAATNSLDSELSQFLSLVQHAGLEAQFELFHDEFEKARNLGNRFASALEHSLQQTGQIKHIKGKSQKGVLICYKIRCAIVHAGSLSPIYDAYVDAPACLEAVLPICESAVIQFLGISLI